MKSIYVGDEQIQFPDSMSDEQILSSIRDKKKKGLVDVYKKPDMSQKPEGFFGGVTRGFTNIADVVKSAADTHRERFSGYTNLGDKIGTAATFATKVIASPVTGSLRTATEALSSIPGIDQLSPAPQSPLYKAAQGIARGYESLPPQVKDVAEMGMNLPIAMGTLGVARSTVGEMASMGAGLEASAAKKLMTSGLKPKDATALRAGKTTLEGTEKIVSDIEKYKLQSTTGGWRGIAENASKKVGLESDIVDNLIVKKAAATPGLTVDIDDSFYKMMRRFSKGDEIAVFGEEAKAQEIANGIHKSLELRGLTGIQPIEKIPEIKRTISEGMKLFKKGKNITEDPLKSKVGELSYLQLRDDLEGVVPEIAPHNKTIHDILIVKKASEEGAKRVGNKNMVSIGDAMTLVGGTSAIGYAFGKSPGLTAGIPGTLFLGGKLASGGRGSSALMSASQMTKSLADALRTPKPAINVSGAASSLRKAVGNQSGSVPVPGSLWEKAKKHIESLKSTSTDWEELKSWGSNSNLPPPRIPTSFHRGRPFRSVYDDVMDKEIKLIHSTPKSDLPLIIGEIKTPDGKIYLERKMTGK